MWHIKTVKGCLYKKYITTNTGKSIKVDTFSKYPFYGYFLIKFKGVSWELLRIMKAGKDEMEKLE